jgi:hypothetical protein
LHFIGGSILALRDDKTPYPLKLDVVFGPTKLTLEGTVQDPFQFKGADVDSFPLSGQTGRRLPFARRSKLPGHRPTAALGKLHREQASGA